MFKFAKTKKRAASTGEWTCDVRVERVDGLPLRLPQQDVRTLGTDVLHSLLRSPQVLLKDIYRYTQVLLKDINRYTQIFLRHLLVQTGAGRAAEIYQQVHTSDSGFSKFVYIPSRNPFRRTLQVCRANKHETEFRDHP